jgi:pimeloyl-ACP methyl ester carboxylesterase
MPAPDAHAGTLRKTAWRLARIAFLSYALICLLAGCASSKLIYHPRSRTTAEVDAEAKGAKMERWTDHAGRPLGMKRLMPGGAPDGTILILHGNGDTATVCSWYATILQRHAKLDCYALEYPGYEDVPGEASRDSILSAARAGLQALDESKPIYLVGESLGSGVAAALAGNHPDKISGLMLLSPYQSLGDVAQAHFPWLPARWLIRDNDFTSADYLRNYHGPVGMLVDGMDEVIPPDCARALYAAYPGPKRLWEHPAGGHLELGQDPDSFWESVLRFWQAEAKSAKK